MEPDTSMRTGAMADGGDKAAAYSKIDFLELNNLTSDKVCIFTSNRTKKIARLDWYTLLNQGYLHGDGSYKIGDSYRKIYGNNPYLNICDTRTSNI